MEAVVLRPRFPARLREATRWQLIGRFVPTSWIVILVWPLTLLLTRGLPTRELAASLLGLATFAAVWVWFWLQPRTGSDPFVSAGVLVGLGAIASVLTFGNPRIWHDGLIGLSAHRAHSPPEAVRPARAAQQGGGGGDLDEGQARARGGRDLGLIGEPSKLCLAKRGAIRDPTRLYAQHGLRNRAEAAATWTRGRHEPAADSTSY